MVVRVFKVVFFVCLFLIAPSFTKALTMRRQRGITEIHVQEIDTSGCGSVSRLRAHSSEEPLDDELVLPPSTALKLQRDASFMALPMPSSMAEYSFQVWGRSHAPQLSKRPFINSTTRDGRKVVNPRRKKKLESVTRA